MRIRTRLLACTAAGAVTLALVTPAGGAGAAGNAAVTPHTPLAQRVQEDNPDNSIDAFALCRVAPALGLSFRYGTPSRGEVDAITSDGVDPTTGNSNSGCTAPQNETTIAVNPRNPRNLIAGANDYRLLSPASGRLDGSGWAYSSFDGGKTWGNVLLPALVVQTGGTGVLSQVDAAGDPAIAFSPDGVAYYANIVFSRNSDASGITVSRSTDGGRTWSQPSVVVFDNTIQIFHDKEWIAAGRDGRVTVTWTRFDSDAAGSYLQSPIISKSSKDSGRTWGPVTPVSDAAHPFNQGSQVSYGEDGELYVAYEGSSPSTAYATDALVVAHRGSDRQAFQTAELDRVYDDFDCYPVYAGRQTLTNQHFRLNSYPSMVVDPDSGTVSVVWADNEGSGTCGQGGSTFSGTTSSQVKLVSGRWGRFGAARRVTSGADKVFPSVGANDGKVVVSYYTAGYTSTNPACFIRIPDGKPAGNFVEPSATSVCLDYASRSSSDGFRSERRLTSEGSNPYVQFGDGSFIGDYSQVAVGKDGVAHAAWTDFRGRPGTNTPNQDVYVSSFR
jgi:hypothetical protein